MKWSEICIHTTQEAMEAISNIVHEAGAGGVVIEDPEDLKREWPDDFGEMYALNPDDYPDEGINIKAYLPVNSYLGETVEEIRTAIMNLKSYDINIGSHTVTMSEVNEEEWATAWKKYYKPTRITDRITITPTWEEYDPSENEIIVELDPGMAFGTGTHPTTVLCLQALETFLQPGDTVLDVGTGSGVLSIAAAKIGAQKVTAVDLDDVAVQVARLNVEQNHVQDTVKVGQNNLVADLSGSYDIIVANILAEVIIRMTDDGAANLLKPEGLLITSGIIQTKRRDVEQAIQKSGLTVIKTLEQGDWVSLVAKKD